MEHMLSHGPQIWDAVLELELPDHLRPHLEKLQSIHLHFFADAVEKLCQSWTSPSSPTTAPTPSPEDQAHITEPLGPTAWLPESSVEVSAEAVDQVGATSLLSADENLAEQIRMPSSQIL
jgi:hypothetical protein